MAGVQLIGEEMVLMQEEMLAFSFFMMKLRKNWMRKCIIECFTKFGRFLCEFVGEFTNIVGWADAMLRDSMLLEHQCTMWHIRKQFICKHRREVDVENAKIDGGVAEHLYCSWSFNSTERRRTTLGVCSMFMRAAPLSHAIPFLFGRDYVKSNCIEINTFLRSRFWCQMVRLCLCAWAYANLYVWRMVMCPRHWHNNRFVLTAVIKRKEKSKNQQNIPPEQRSRAQWILMAYTAQPRVQQSL